MYIFVMDNCTLLLTMITSSLDIMMMENLLSKSCHILTNMKDILILYFCRFTIALVNHKWPLILHHLRTKSTVLFLYHFWADIIRCSQYSVCTLVRGRHHFTDSKVSDIDYTFLCKKYVRRFQIPTKRNTVRIHS